MITLKEIKWIILFVSVWFFYKLIWELLGSTSLTTETETATDFSAKCFVCRKMYTLYVDIYWNCQAKTTKIILQEDKLGCL